MANPVLTIAPYLLAFSQMARAVADISESFNAGELTEEEAAAKWAEAVSAVTQADARWISADQAARS